MVKQISNEISIRDPIHNYIYLTEVESRLVRHPLFQRLRFISQNGSAYFTYPSNRNCRFLHSLGCMKIGGDIFLSVTENLYDPTIQRFLDEAYNMISDICTEQLTTRLETVVEHYVNRKDKTLIKYGLDLDISTIDVNKEIKNMSFQRRFSRAVLFQSLRLACVLHDIGHFPFSHTLERAFKSSIQNFSNQGGKKSNLVEQFQKLSREFSSSNQLHENIGLRILKHIIPTPENDFHRLCRSLARAILTEKLTGHERVVKTLHFIVSGEVDADRLDYCIRDPHASGLELGAFDLERLVNNLVLFFNGKEYKVLPKIQALSAVESFYHQRYLLYKYLIYHHSKVRMDAIIEEITVLLLSIYFREKDGQIYNKIKDILANDHFDYLWNQIGEDKYYHCSENWYFNLLHNIWLCLSENLTDSSSVELNKLYLLSETFLFRKTENLFSLYKRYDQYYSFLLKLKDDVNETGIRKLNIRLKALIPELKIDTSIYEFINEIYQQFKVIVLLVEIPPKIVDIDKDTKQTSLKIVTEDRAITSEKLSPYLTSLKQMVETDQIFHIFFLRDNIKDSEDDRSKIKQKLIEFLASKYKEKYMEV